MQRVIVTAGEVSHKTLNTGDCRILQIVVVSISQNQTLELDVMPVE